VGRVGNRKKGKIAARENFQKNILAAADLSTVRQKFFCGNVPVSMSLLCQF